jgi:putative transposase
MSRNRFTIGVRYLLNEQVYLIKQLLQNDQVLAENQSFGGQVVVSVAELSAAWARDELRFEVQGKHAAAHTHQALATDYAFADFQQLPERYRAEAWRRYSLIKPLLALPPDTCTWSYLQEYVQLCKAQTSPPITENACDVASGKPGGLQMGKALSASSLHRWLRDFSESGYDVRALVPSYARSGTKGTPRLPLEGERILEQVFAECQRHPMQRTVNDVYLMVIHRIAEENRTRPPDYQIDHPGQTTVYRRIKQAGNVSILRRRRSRMEQQADAPVAPGPSLTHILQRVEIDHTLLDLFLVDEEDRLPIGRPTLTFALDVYSGFPLGVFVGFEPPSYRAVMNCLLHALLPKADARELYDTRNGWIAYGLPELLIIDHGKEFIGRDLDDACAQLGMLVERLPVQAAWFKGTIERFFRTNNTGLIHTLPGTSFSNILERGDYDSMKHACISLTAFWKLLHVFLLDYYAQNWHDGRECIPAKRWAECVQSGFLPALHTSAEETRILLYPGDTRTLQRAGIEFETLRYQSPDLSRLRSVLPRGTPVRCKYDPGDISALYVCDPTVTHTWLRVPAVDQAYTQGLSLWKHRLIRGYVLREKGAVDIAALAAAKAHIQQIAAEEFSTTRQGRGRKTAARYLDIGTQAAPGTTPPPAPEPAAPADASVSAPVPPPTPPPAPLPCDSRAETEGFDTTGWGGDYNLPRGRPTPDPEETDV